MEKILIIICVKDRLISKSDIPNNTTRIWYARNINDFAHAITLACYIADKVNDVEINIEINEEINKNILKNIISNTIKENLPKNSFSYNFI